MRTRFRWLTMQETLAKMLKRKYPNEDVSWIEKADIRAEQGVIYVDLSKLGYTYKGNSQMTFTITNLHEITLEQIVSKYIKDTNELIVGTSMRDHSVIVMEELNVPEIQEISDIPFLYDSTNNLYVLDVNNSPDKGIGFITNGIGQSVIYHVGVANKVNLNNMLTTASGANPRTKEIQPISPLDFLQKIE